MTLYLPKAFHEPDTALLHDLIEAHPFGVLIAVGDDGAPMIAHLPFLLDRGSGPLGTLRAHVARRNPIERAFDGEKPLVAVFRGPHGYVSPGWYASRDDVPTWNYAVAHASGVGRRIEDPGELAGMLARLADAHELGRPEPWSTDELSDETRSALLPAIVGVALSIGRLEGKLKLSQNRRSEDREGAIRGLVSAGTPDALALAAMMRQAADRLER